MRRRAPACATPQAGNHHDLFNIEALFGEVCALVEEVQIWLEGLFLNADSGFDASSLRNDCFRRDIETNIAPNPRSGQREAAADPYFDEGLYRQRTAVVTSDLLPQNWTKLK